MSHSFKKVNIVKDNKNKSYWKTIRRCIKQAMNINPEELPNPKEIINDYDWRDYWFFSTQDKTKRK